MAGSFLGLKGEFAGIGPKKSKGGIRPFVARFRTVWRAE